MYFEIVATAFLFWLFCVWKVEGRFNRLMRTVLGVLSVWGIFTVLHGLGYLVRRSV